MKYIFCLLLVFVVSSAAFAQKQQSLYLGAGFGFDHGGLGAKAEFQPTKYIGLFGGLGYNFANVGANGGIIFNILPDKRVTPVLTAMYGYNAVVKVEYLDGNDYAVYNGLTIGGGVDIKLGRHLDRHKLNVNLLVPFRNPDFFRDYNYIRENGEIKQEILPVAISFGWSFNVFSK